MLDIKYQYNMNMWMRMMRAKNGDGLVEPEPSTNDK